MSFWTIPWESFIPSLGLEVSLPGTTLCLLNRFVMFPVCLLLLSKRKAYTVTLPLKNIHICVQKDIRYISILTYPIYKFTYIFPYQKIYRPSTQTAACCNLMDLTIHAPTNDSFNKPTFRNNFPRLVSPGRIDFTKGATTDQLNLSIRHGPKEWNDCWWDEFAPFVWEPEIHKLAG